MKKTITLLFVIFFLVHLKAQVGINTESPQGIFHVDPYADTKGNLNVKDDILIDSYGNVGIGTLNPQSKLEIISSTPGAIRISDTSEGISKVLASSSSGTISWINLIGSWNASLMGGNLPYTTSTTTSRKINFTSGTISNPNSGSINIPNGSIVIPHNGVYRITLFGTSLINRSSGYFIAGYYSVRRNSNSIWEPHSLGYTQISRSPYVSHYSFAYLTKNDVLDLYSIENSAGFANAVSNLTFFVEFVK